MPTFKENKHVRGVMKVTCSTPGSKAWLTAAIQRTTPIWPNMNLIVVDFDKLPQQNRVLGLFPNCAITAEQIRHMLGAMNPHMNVGCWNDRQRCARCIWCRQDAAGYVECKQFQTIFRCWLGNFQGYIQIKRRQTATKGE